MVHITDFTAQVYDLILEQFKSPPTVPVWQDDSGDEIPIYQDDAGSGIPIYQDDGSLP